MNLSTENKIMDLENRLVVAWGEQEGVGGIGSLGSMDAKYCSWNEIKMRSCCVNMRTMSRQLQPSTTMGEKIMYTYMCNWVPTLYSGKKRVFGEITIKNKFKKLCSIYYRLTLLDNGQHQIFQIVFASTKQESSFVEGERQKERGS